MIKKFIVAFCLFSLALFAQSDQKGLAQEITKAPDGISIKLAKDGSFQIFSVASGSYDFDDVDDVLSAQKEATLKAKAAIAKFMEESLDTKEKFEKASKKIKKISSKNNEKDYNIDKTTAKKLLLEIKSSASALLKGVIVLSTAKIPAKGTTGTFKVMVGVSSKTLTAVSKLNNGLSDTPITPMLVQSSLTSNTETTSNVQTSSSQKPPLPEGWIECIGEGVNRKEAVINALIEGVQQVYGVLLRNNSAYAENINKFKINAFKLNSTIKEIQTNTLTATCGLIKEFRIIEEIPLGENKVKITIYAHIINPRSNNVISLLIYDPIMNFEQLNRTYTCGPKKEISGSDLIKEVKKSLINSFVNSNKYMVYTHESIANVIKQQNNNISLVAMNLSPSYELLKACQILTCDYILTCKIEELKYFRVTQFNPKTNKFSPFHNMSLIFNYKITNVTTGKIIFFKEISLSLTNEEIKPLLENDSNTNLVRVIINKATTIISKSIPKK